MNYKSLFNLLYSTEISEATKSSIIDRIQEPIIESCEAEPLVETYLELLDTLVYSTASESLIYNIIDETFSSLDEAFINEVSDEWVKRKTEAGLKQRENAYKQAQDSVKSGLIGLSQLRRQDAAKAKLEKGREIAANRAPKAPTDNQPKAEGAMGKLKSAVGKVKQWAEKVSPMPKEHDHVGLGRLIGHEANKRGIGAETLRQQTTHKAEGSTETPKAEAPEVKVEKPKAEKVKKSRVTKPKVEKTQEAPKAEAKQPEMKSEVKAEDATKATKTAKKTSKKTEKVKQPELKSEVKAETPKKEKAEQQKLNLETPAETKQPEAKIEKPKATKKTSKKIEKVQETPKAEENKSKEEDSTNDSIKKSNKKGKIELVKNIAKNKVKDETPQLEVKSTEEEKPKEVKAETPKEEPKIKVDMEKKDPEVAKQEKKDEQRWNREAARIMQDKKRALQNNKDRYQAMISKPGYDADAASKLKETIDKLEKEVNGTPVTANEAFSDLAILLLNTNITESCFVEVMEMVAASKTNADKVKKRLEQKKTEAMDDLYKEVAKGKPESPKKIEALNKIVKREERFNALYNKKFNNNN